MKKTLIFLLSFLCLAACHKTTAPEAISQMSYILSGRRKP